MKRLILVSLVFSACSILHPGPPSPRAVARRECDAWLQRHNLMQRPRAGTRAYDQLIDVCVAQHLSAAAEIDNALAR